MGVSVTWIVLVLLVSSSTGFVPERLMEDLFSLLNYMNIHMLTVMQNDHVNENMETEKFVVSSLKLFVFGTGDVIWVNFVKCGDFDKMRLTSGAVLTSVPGVCDIQKMIYRSDLSRPLLLYLTNDSLLPELTKRHHIPFDSSVNLISKYPKAPDGQRLTLQEAYHLQDSSRDAAVINVLGSTRVNLDGKSVWLFNGDSNSLLRRGKLQGVQIKTVYPAVLFSKVDASGLIASVTSGRDIVNLIADIINCSIAPVILNDVDLVGELGADGNWSGPVGMLQRREADLSLVAIASKSPLLDKVLDRTVAYSTGNYRMYLRKPEFTYSLKSTVRSFRIGSWIGILVTLFVFATVLTAMSHLSQLHLNPSQPIYTFAESLLVLLGWERVPSSMSGQIFMVSSACLGFLVNTLFVMQLQSGIAAKTAPMPFQSLEEMLLTRYTPLMFAGSAPHAHTMSANQGVWKSVQDLMQRKPDSAFKNFSSAANRVCHEEVAILAWPVFMSNVLRTAKCTIVDIKRDFFTVAVSLATSKRFRFHNSINYGILRARESGLINKIRSHLRERPLEETVMFQVIEIEDVAPFLILYGAAICLVIIIFLVEAAIFYV